MSSSLLACCSKRKKSISVQLMLMMSKYMEKGASEGKEVKGWSCWQALNVQLPHIALHYTLYPRHLSAHRMLSFLQALCFGNEVASGEATIWSYVTNCAIISSGNLIIFQSDTVGLVNTASVHCNKELYPFLSLFPAFMQAVMLPLLWTSLVSFSALTHNITPSGSVLFLVWPPLLSFAQWSTITPNKINCELNQAETTMA